MSCELKKGQQTDSFCKQFATTESFVATNILDERPASFFIAYKKKPGEHSNLLTTLTRSARKIMNN